MQPDQQGVLLIRIEAGREIDVEIAPLLEGRRPDPAVNAVVVGEINKLSRGCVDLPVPALQHQRCARPALARVGLPRQASAAAEEDQHAERSSDFHGCLFMRSREAVGERRAMSAIMGDRGDAPPCMLRPWQAVM